MSAGDADEVVRWDFCRLDLLLLFGQAKSREKKLILGLFLFALIFASNAQGKAWELEGNSGTGKGEILG